MTQTGPDPTPVPLLTPPARARRLAARLQGKCLRTRGVAAALHEIGVLDSGTLAALPRLSGDLIGYQETDPLPADPLRQLLPAPARRPRGWLPLPGRRPPPGPPVLSHEQWQAWQAEVGRTAEHLGRQWDRLAGFQARQAALQAELQADIETLVLAAAEVRDDPALPPDWRQDLDSALRGRVGDLQVALTVAVQLGEATDQLLRNHQLMQGRLQVAAGLLVHAAQTGRTLQQALADQVRLQALPPFSSAFSPDSPDQE